jgi:hypothetical protein
MWWAFDCIDFPGGLADCREREKIEDEGSNVRRRYVVFNGTLREVESTNSTLRQIPRNEK